MLGPPPTTAALLRRKLLWMLTTMAVAFTVAFIDGLLMLRNPGHPSYLGFRVDDVGALVRTSGIIMIGSLGAIGIILTMWKTPKA